ncbi:hypothetical protein C5E41_13390 [Nocardia nova]|nr:hypothetical protein C5E41_13390 [Nocardia nova]
MVSTQLSPLGTWTRPAGRRVKLGGNDVLDGAAFVIDIIWLDAGKSLRQRRCDRGKVFDWSTSRPAVNIECEQLGVEQVIVGRVRTDEGQK